ncbi:MAG TPA: hypothetical protein PLK94_03740 [Alphaproteobacteria bacterium]|nr:hypothetical protein [Alphaproteobacteria bacterium]HOO50384.1 hypothetical protein [Alphaproteobacteria bacterium]
MATNIELGQLPDGDFALVCDSSLPSGVKRVEYYRDQRLFMLVYDIPEHEGELMQYELKEDIAEKVKKRSSLVIVEPDSKTGRPMGYYTSLIQVGA